MDSFRGQEGGDKGNPVSKREARLCGRRPESGWSPVPAALLRSDAPRPAELLRSPVTPAAVSSPADCVASLAGDTLATPVLLRCYFRTRFRSRRLILLSRLSLRNALAPGHTPMAHAAAATTTPWDPARQTSIPSPPAEAPPLHVPGLSLPRGAPCGPSLSPVVHHVIKEEQAPPCGRRGAAVSAS